MRSFTPTATPCKTPVTCRHSGQADEELHTHLATAASQLGPRFINDKILLDLLEASCHIPDTSRHPPPPTYRTSNTPRVHSAAPSNTVHLDAALTSQHGPPPRTVHLQTYCTSTAHRQTDVSQRTMRRGSRRSTVCTPRDAF